MEPSWNSRRARKTLTIRLISIVRRHPALLLLQDRYHLLLDRFIVRLLALDELYPKSERFRGSGHVPERADTDKILRSWGRLFERRIVWGADAMAHRVFLVESPFQALCATEARLKISSDEAATIVTIRRHPDRSRNEQQIGLILDRYGWQDRLHLDIANGTPLSKFLRIMGLLRSLQDAAGSAAVKVFIGEYRYDLMHFIGNALSAEESWLLDDGAAMLQIRSCLDKGWSALRPWSFRPFGLFLLGVAVPRGWAPPAYQGRFIFTIFDSLLIGERVVPNRLEGLRKTRRPTIRLDEAWIIGQKLSESGICAVDAEVSAIKQIATGMSARSERILYMAHRDDSTDKLRRIADLGLLRVRKNEAPVELQIDQESLPGTVGGFYSTALFTLHQLVPEMELTAFRLPRKQISAAYVEYIGTCYQALQHFGIRVEQLRSAGS